MRAYSEEAMHAGPELRMKPFDKLLRRWRISKAAPYVRPGARVLDIGCGTGALFERFEPIIAEGVGIDPALREPVVRRNWRLVKGRFPDDLPGGDRFDLITMLAVLEHIPRDDQEAVAREVAKRLKPGGYVVITVPSSAVDPIAHGLIRLRVMTAAGVEQHWGFDHRTTPGIFAPAGLAVVKARRFQLGLNNCYVLQRRAVIGNNREQGSAA